MSSSADADFQIEYCQLDAIFSQLEADGAARNKIATALEEANAAFAAQFNRPDGVRYKDTCDQLAKLLEIKDPLDNHAQQLLVQVLQVACAMHEIALQNLELTPGQRSAHLLSTTSLAPLCRSALNKLTESGLYNQASELKKRAERALFGALVELNPYRYYLSGGPEDVPICVPTEDSVEQTSATPSPVPASLDLPTPAKPAMPRVSALHTTTCVWSITESTSMVQKALTFVNDRPSRTPLKYRWTSPQSQMSTILRVDSLPIRTSTASTSSQEGSDEDGRVLSPVQEPAEGSE